MVDYVEIMKQYGMTRADMETVISGLEKHISENIRDEFPDPNPLASLFSGYLGDDIADYVLNRRN